MPSSRRERLLRATTLAPFAVVLVLHVAAVFTESVNWDEFALLERSARSLNDGTLYGGGRPGLVTLLLTLLVDGCDDAIRVVRSARLLWVLPTVVYLVGFYWLLRRALARQVYAWHSAVFGLAHLVFVPVFLRWSIHVRTDQVALAGGMFGACLLLASRSRPLLALGAGVAFGAGLLSSQKLLYTLPICAVLAALEQWHASDWRWRRELLRTALCCAGGALSFALFRIATLDYAEAPQILSIRSDVVSFDVYAKVVTFRSYVCMIPTLSPHLIAAVLLVAASFDQLLRRETARAELLAAWTLVAVGIAIGVLHRARFPYFWMTLGLYPATAIAIAQQPIFALLRRPVPRVVYGSLAWLVLAGQGLPYAVRLLIDTQKPQRESLEFVRRNFLPSAQGYHPEGALFCPLDKNPMPVMMLTTIINSFAKPGYDAAFMREFRERPISYLIHTMHFGLFPVNSQINALYVPYRHNVWVTGRRLNAGRGKRQVVELLVGGLWTWIPLAGTPAIRIGERTLVQGDTLDLIPGRHVVELSDGQEGLLVPKLAEPPDLTASPPFYGDEMLAEITGRCWMASGGRGS